MACGEKNAQTWMLIFLSDNKRGIQDRRSKVDQCTTKRVHSLVHTKLFYQNFNEALRGTLADVASCVRLFALGCVRRERTPHLNVDGKFPDRQCLARSEEHHITSCDTHTHRIQPNCTRQGNGVGEERRQGDAVGD